MNMQNWDPNAALGVFFPDANLARCVRATAKTNAQYVETLKCFQCGIRDLTGIEHLVNLMSLDLHFNEISRGTDLATLRRLKELHIGLNACPDIAFLSTMTTLQSLTLFDNEIEDCSAVVHLVNLEVLHLRFNEIEDISPISNLSKLKELSISANLIDDLTPLSNLPQIEIVNFYKNYVEDISAFQNAHKLKEIYLGQNPIQDISVLFDKLDLIECKYDGTQIPDNQKAYVDQLVASNKKRLGLDA